MLTPRYMTSIKNLPKILESIQDGAAPSKFTSTHLRSVGFKSSNDQSVLALLKDLKFLTADGTPTQRYLNYRDRSRAKAVLAEALREAYEDLFHVKEHPTDADKAALQGKFKATHNVTDRVAKEQTNTFLALLKLADLNAATTAPAPKVAAPVRKATKERVDDADDDAEEEHDDSHAKPPRTRSHAGSIGLRYNIEVHLPATKDVEVYNAIFKSLKEHLLDD